LIGIAEKLRSPAAVRVVGRREPPHLRGRDADSVFWVSLSGPDRNQSAARSIFLIFAP
jgi:hypothetical protein